MTRTTGLLIASTLCLSCAHGPSIAVEALIDVNATNPPVIHRGDALDVEVVNSKKHTVKKGIVQDDGKIYLPVVGGEFVAGLTTTAASTNIAQRLIGVVDRPKVAVMIVDAKIEVGVLGEVSRPGIAKLPPGSGVLHAIAAARGFTLYADRDRILVMRRGGKQMPIRFSYRALLAGERKAASFVLQTGDTVVVE
jgi:polysaccharide biosynthesis/export protein